nr:hypothetical protein [Tanacetum cinerariifolium]
MLHWFFLSSNAFPFAFICVMFERFGDEVIGFGIKNLSLLEGGSSYETFSSESFSIEAWTTRVVDLAVAPPELDQGFEDLESSMMFGRMFLSVLESSSGIRSSKASTTILGTASSSFLDTFLAREDSQLSTLLERDDTSSCR